MLEVQRHFRFLFSTKLSVLVKLNICNDLSYQSFLRNYSCVGPRLINDYPSIRKCFFRINDSSSGNNSSNTQIKVPTLVFISRKSIKCLLGPTESCTNGMFYHRIFSKLWHVIPCVNIKKLTCATILKCIFSEIQGFMSFFLILIHEVMSPSLENISWEKYSIGVWSIGSGTFCLYFLKTVHYIEIKSIFISVFY